MIMAEVIELSFKSIDEAFIEETFAEILELQKSGELKSFAFVALTKEGRHFAGNSGIDNVYEMIGALEVMKREIMDSE
jgi:hypothetical protein